MALTPCAPSLQVHLPGTAAVYHGAEDQLARDLPERQWTMRAALDWSHDLLSGPERVLFRRLSVFVGGIALEAAEAVRDPQGGAVWPLDLLSALVEQSLATVYPHAGGEARYGLLEPVRQYGLEKLEHSGEFGEIQRRHAEYFLGLSEGAAPELWGAG